ncbi:glutamate--cysteine ligase, chloroplastic [Fagus crenata]
MEFEVLPRLLPCQHAVSCSTSHRINLIGTEHEKFGSELGTLRPISYGQIAELLNGIAERFYWDKIMEGDNVVGLRQGKQSVTLEPGGQLELSGAPLETLHQTYFEIYSHLCQLDAHHT